MKPSFKIVAFCLASVFALQSPIGCADNFLSESQGTLPESLPTLDSVTTPTINAPKIVSIPQPPVLNASAYILIDVNSGKILAEKDSDKQLPPASLTKMMTLYVVSHTLAQNQLQLSDRVHISEKAWKTGGSRMFVKVNDAVAVEDLLKGIIVHSGNDACVALAEHVGGSETTFAELMNQHAAALGMRHSHFTDSTGLPDPNHYSSAKDLAILGRALIKNYPQYYHWYKEKWFSYNNIRQPNRNRLLWRDNYVDGIKTGHTDEAGFCLVSSALKDNMRLLAVVLGAPSDSSRADDSERLLNYGFQFYETKSLFKTAQVISKAPLYKGTQDTAALGVKQDVHVTFPRGRASDLKVHSEIPKNLEAPIQKGDKVGEIQIQLDGHTIATQNLYALEAVPVGGLFVRMKDSIRMHYHRWVG